MMITYENLSKFAYVNEEHLVGAPRGICMEFFGLGYGAMVTKNPDRAEQLGKAGVLFVNPFLNPWAWMNDQAREMSDAILDALMSYYGELPVVSTGGSMGGHAALMFTIQSRHRVVGCCANCPVCDLPFHAYERDDSLHTVYSAYYGTADFETTLREHSPYHLVDCFPDIPYHIFHCCEDKAVNKKMHSDRFVPLLKEHHTVTYDEVPDCGHCALPPEMKEKYNAYILSCLD